MDVLNKECLTIKTVSEIIAMPRVVSEASTTIIPNVYGNLWVHEVHLPLVGLEKGIHKHEFDHMHLIVSGVAKLQILDDDKEVIKEETHTAPSWIKIPKLLYHNIISEAENTIGYCIHAVRNSDDEVIDSNLDSFGFVPPKDLKE